jgi:hypothetical protein
MVKKVKELDEVKNAPSSEEILEQMKETAPKSSSNNKEIDDLLSGYKEKIEINEPAAIERAKETRGRKKKTQEPAQPEIQTSPVITGALMMMLIDLGLPHLIAFANNKLNKKGKKIKASDLRMTEEQRKELEPVADQVAHEMMLQANPLTVLIISMIGIYGINFMMLKQE